MLHSHLPSSERSNTPTSPLSRSHSWSTTGNLYTDTTLHEDKPEDLIIRLGRRRRLGFIALIPTVITMFVSAGFATMLIVWLLEKCITDHPPNEDAFFRGSIVVIESSSGPRAGADGSVTSESTLYGLVISSTASHLISITVSFLMALVAYRVAADWLHAQSLPTGQDPKLPTPAQYGLLLKLCGSSNISSAWDTCRYLWASKDTTPRASASLKRALLALVFILFLTHTVGAADFWLHTAASTFIHTNLEQLSNASLPMVGTDINITTCPGPNFMYYGPIPGLSSPQTPPDPGEAPGPYTLLSFSCGVDPQEPGIYDPNGWGSPGMIGEGAAAAANQSNVNMVVLVEDTAVLLPKSMPQDVGEAVLPTFGLTTQCMPITQCSVEQSPDIVDISCSSFSRNLKFAISSTMPEPGIQQYNLTDPDNITLPYTRGYPWESLLNPYGAVIQLVFTSAEDVQVMQNNTPGWYILDRLGIDMGPVKTIIASCITTAHNITLSYSLSSIGSSSYSIVKDPSNFNTTSALLAAYDPSLSTKFITYLHSRLDSSLGMPTEDFMTLLSESVSIGVLGFASPLMARTAPYSAKRAVMQSASRYPLAPLCTIVATLYAYALLALVLCFWTAFSTSHEVILQVGPTPRRVTALELTQLRLTDPLAFVAQHFGGSSREPGASLETPALRVFDERENEQRLKVGLLSVWDDDGTYKRKAFGISRVGVNEDEIPLNSEL